MSIVDCGEDKDSTDGYGIGNCGVDTNGGSDPDFGDDKTKVTMQLVMMAIVKIMVVLMTVLVLILMTMIVMNMMGKLMEMIMIMMATVMMLMVVVMMKVKMIMTKYVIMLMVMLKMVVEVVVMIKMILILRMMKVLKANFCNPFSLAFPQFLMRIYHFLVQFYVNNLWSTNNVSSDWLLLTQLRFCSK